MQLSTRSTVRSFFLRTLVLTVVAVTTGCGGGGGGDRVPEPPAPPAVTLTGRALYAERIALRWTAENVLTDPAYAVTVDGSVVAYTTREGYEMVALPQTRYCFTVVMGELVPPFKTFAATGPTSNELCLTTPSLPALAPGWSTADAGLGHGDLPAIARRPAGTEPGLFACVAGAGGSFFGLLGSRGIVLPSFTFAGESCAVADNGSADPGLHALTRSGASTTYRWAVPGPSGWSFSSGVEITSRAEATTPLAQALDADLQPQVLFASGGQSYWTGRDLVGRWSAPELVGPGTVGPRSLTVAPDGTVYAFLAQGGGAQVWRRAAPGRWTMIHAIDGTGDAQHPQWPGSIVAAASGGLRLAFRRPTGVAYLEWSGGSSHWTETLVDKEPATASPALALDLAGEPLIAYGDWRGDLRLSRRRAGQWSTAVIDALGDLAAQTDVEVDNEGTVYILYSDRFGAAKLATGH